MFGVLNTTFEDFTSQVRMHKCRAHCCEVNMHRLLFIAKGKMSYICATEFEPGMNKLTFTVKMRHQFASAAWCEPSVCDTVHVVC